MGEREKERKRKRERERVRSEVGSTVRSVGGGSDPAGDCEVYLPKGGSRKFDFQPVARDLWRDMESLSRD